MIQSPLRGDSHSGKTGGRRGAERFSCKGQIGIKKGERLPVATYESNGCFGGTILLDTDRNKTDPGLSTNNLLGRLQRVGAGVLSLMQ